MAHRLRSLQCRRHRRLAVPPSAPSHPCLRMRSSGTRPSLRSWIAITMAGFRFASLSLLAQQHTALFWLTQAGFMPRRLRCCQTLCECVQGGECFNFMIQWGLGRELLREIWALVAGDSGQLSTPQFISCLYLMDNAKQVCARVHHGLWWITMHGNTRLIHIRKGLMRSPSQKVKTRTQNPSSCHAAAGRRMQTKKPSGVGRCPGYASGVLSAAAAGAW